MFLDPDRQWPRDEPPRQPPRGGPELNPRQQKTLGWIVAFNLIMLLMAPICGETLIGLLIEALRR